MDISEIGVRHALSVNTLNIRHSLDISPSLAKEIRYCVIAIVAGWTAVNLLKTVALLRQQPQRPSS